MKTFTKMLALILTVALLLIAVGCVASDKQTGTVTLTDMAGRTVELEKPAERLVSCYYVTSYAMLALGISDRLVGIEKKADSRPIYGMANASVLSLPVVGSLKEISVETIASLSPDLVILPKKLANAGEALDELGIPYIIVNPETYDGLCTMLTLIAKACGVSERAERLISYYNEKLDGPVTTDDKPTAVILGNSDYLTAAPGGMYQNDLISLAGGVNLFGEQSGDTWTAISYETLLSMNPDYIIIPSGAAYTADDLRNDSELAGLSAVQNGKILSFPGTFEEWDSPIPSCVLGVLWLRAHLQPGLYSEESFKKDLKYFYENFYGFSPEDTALDSVG